MKNFNTFLPLFLLFYITCSSAYAQCPAGEVEVIFTLDMTCADTDLRPPVVTGPFNNFSGDGNIMADPDGDDIWEAIICAVPGSSFEYKYAILNFVEQENLIDDAIGGAPCPYNTDFFSYSNRLVTIPAGGGALPIDTYGICGTCDNPPINVTFTVNMNCSDVTPGTPVAMFGGFNGFCCPYGLEDPDGDNVWTTTLPFPPDENGCITMEYLYMSPDFSNVEAFLTNGEDLANCPNINTDFATFANRIIMVCSDTVLDDYWNTCFAPEEPAGGCDDNICDNGFESWDGCECISTAAVFGCTDEIASNYDPNANCDDGNCIFDDCQDPCAPNFGEVGSCEPYDTTCNTDCSVGPFGGIWDPVSCACVNETIPVLGCTFIDACNYNPNANCDDPNNPCIPFPQCNTDGCAGDLEIPDPDDPCTCIVDQPQLTGCSNPGACDYNPLATCDGACDTGNPACADPCDEIPGCTDSTACNYDPNACVDDGTCDFGVPVCMDPCNPLMGCTDNTACNFNPGACLNDDSCDFGNLACNLPCNPVMGCTNPLNCNYNPDACIEDGSCNPDSGCTDDTACNFDIDACVDDGSCDYGNLACPDPCNEPTNIDDGCDLTTDSFDAATCAVVNEPNCPAGTTFNPGTCACDTDVILGCTDACADNFDPNAEVDDGSCNPYDDTCNQDCTLGPFGGTWDPATCGCINEITPVLGCIDGTYCEYTPDVNCDDGSCNLSLPAAGIIDGGPFTFCVGDDVPDFVSGITVANPGGAANIVWVITDDQLNILDLPSMPEEVDFDLAPPGNCLIWYLAYEEIFGAEVGMNATDLTGCFVLSNSIEVIREDCIIPCEAEAATTSGGPFIFCAGDGMPDFVSGITVSGGAGTNTAWVITDDALNILALPGMPGEVDFDGAGFGICLIWYLTFNDIVGAEVGANAADLTGCFALSNSIEVVREDCPPCEDEISGTINTEPTCDVSGIAVLITDAAGNPIGMAIADASGSYALSGVYPCGDYIATLDAASLPACYTDAGGDVGPAGFVIDGDGNADGADFSSFNEVPTLSQWGLIILALLLMTFGALKLGFHYNTKKESIV